MNDEPSTVEDRAGLQSIGEVVQLLQRDYPSVTQSSLRFFEREGLVHPARTPGGHRLYRPADIERIRRIKRLQDERYTLEEIAERLTEDDRALPDVETFLELAVVGDAARATRLLTAAVEGGTPPETVFDDLLSPTLTKIGERWASGRLTVAQEHAASELIRDLIAVAGGRHIEPADDAPGVIAAAVAGERHVIGLQMVATLLRLRGIRVQFLGADVAPEFLTDAIRRHEPDFVLLSATLDERLAAVEQAVAAIRNIALPRQPRIIVGGQIARHLHDQLSALDVIPIDNQLPGATVGEIVRLTDAIDRRSHV